MASWTTTEASTVGPSKTYATLAAWYAAKKDDATKAPWAECYGGADLQPVTISAGTGGTPTSSYYVKVYSATGQRHDATRSGTKGAYIAQTAGNPAIVVTLAYTRVVGIRGDMINAGGSATGVFYADTVTGVVFDSCLIVQMDAQTGTGAKRGISIRSLAASQTGTVQNCVFYGHASTTETGTSAAILIFTNAGVTNAAVAISNNSVYGWTPSGSRGGIWIQAGAGNAGQFALKNNLSFGNAKDYYWTDANSLSATAAANNMSGDATADDAGGSGYLISQTFANVCTSANDLHLKAGSAAILAGTNPAILALDALDNVRNAAGPDDMGALTTYVVMQIGYRLYRGTGGLANVEFSSPVGIAGIDASATTLAGLGHDPLTRYTYVLRPVRKNEHDQWVETADFSCTAELETDAAGQLAAKRPTGLGRVWGQALAVGALQVWWEFQTPYGGARPAGFAVYSGSMSNSVSMLHLWQPYTRDGLYCGTLELPPGTYWLAVTVCGEAGVESFPSPPLGPYVIRGASSAPLTVLVEETQ